MKDQLTTNIGRCLTDMPRRRFIQATVAAIGVTTVGTTPVLAVELVERNAEEHGETEIEFDSSFEDPDYDCGVIEMTVNWTVLRGSARFEDFGLRGPQFTPKGPDSADGRLGGVEDGTGGETLTQGQSGSAGVTFEFTELHFDEERDTYLGNAHFTLDLRVDTDGDGALDSSAGHGVNVHVESGGDC